MVGMSLFIITKSILNLFERLFGLITQILFYMRGLLVLF